MRVLLLSLLLWPLVCFSKDPLAYYGVPLFYSHHTPKIAPCAFDNESKLGSCGWTSYPIQIQVTLARSTQPELQQKEMIDTYREVVCIDESCYTSKYNDPAGFIKGFKGTSYWSVPVGYYLAVLNNEVKAVKYGNGPYVNQFPIRDVLVPFGESVDGEHYNLKQTEGTYNVQCNVETEHCNYLGMDVTLLKLALLVPFAKTTDCDELLCYTNSTKQWVAGINPNKREDIFRGM